jgi:hypothetical protein
MRVFGCTAYAHVDVTMRNSLPTTSVKCKFLGYASYQKGYILQPFNNNLIIVQRHVEFDEQSILELPNAEPSIAEGRSIFVIDDQGFEIGAHYTIENDQTPQSFQEAEALPDADKWRAAALEELQSHAENETWSLVDLPSGAKAIKSRWVFTKKPTPNGHIRYKARFVAKDFSQRPGIDYNDTYASVLAYTSFRLLVCIAVNKGWKLHQKDCKTTYLNAPLLTPIYIEQPEGFVEQGNGKTKVCVLNKALYGLKQAGRAWQHRLFDLIASQDYKHVRIILEHIGNRPFHIVPQNIPTTSSIQRRRSTCSR